MSADLISIKTRQVFREYMVGWVLRQISDEFDAALIDCDTACQPAVSGQRRSLIEQYYNSINWASWNDIRKVLQVYENVLDETEKSIDEIGLEQVWRDTRKKIFDKLIHFLRKDGFERRDGRLVRGAGLPRLDDVKEAALVFDARHMTDQIRRMEAAVESDPSLAIGTAKELIETCCKTILAERGKEIVGVPDISGLTKETLRELRLVPEGVSEATRGSDVIKRLLSNLGAIGNGLAELRGLYGTGHGKHAKTSGLSPRHAKLAVGAATTLVTFLFETHKEKSSQMSATTQ